jgi:hypothetical protein
MLFFALVVMHTTVLAQDESCEVTLANAIDEFQNGHFYAIPSILDACMDKFTAEQQQRANVLLAETYLLLDDPLGAKNAYLRVLKANPEFVADENIQPSDFVYLSKRFTSAPVFSWFFKAGANVSPIRVIYDVDAFDKNAREKYRLKFGYQVAAGGDLYIMERIGLRAELNYLLATYQHSTRNFFQDDTKEFHENQNWINLPAMFTYTQKTGKYRPYGYAGFSFGYLIRDVARGNIVKVKTSEDTKDGQQSPDWNFAYKRNRINQSVLVGGGLKMKFGLQYLFVDMRYGFSLHNAVNPNNLYANNKLAQTSDGFITSGSPSFSYAHVDDFFRLDNLSLSVGYLHPLYKPREMRRYRKKNSSPKSSN